MHNALVDFAAPEIPHARTVSHAYTGLDRFGRIVDQNWFLRTTAEGSKGTEVSTLTQVDRFQYGYDGFGRPVFRKNLLAPDLSESYLHPSIIAQVGSVDRGVIAADGEVAEGQWTTREGVTRQEERTWVRPDLQADHRYTVRGAGGSVTKTWWRYHDDENLWYRAEDYGGSGPAGGSIPRIQRNTTVDPWGRVVQVRTPIGPAGGDVATLHEYDALGRLTFTGTSAGGEVTDGWYLDYDASGRVIARVGFAGTTARDIIYSANTGLIATVAEGGTKLYLLQDPRASVTAVVAKVDNQWQVNGRYIYSLNGEPTYLTADWQWRGADPHSIGFLSKGSVSLGAGLCVAGGSAIFDIYIGGAPSDTGLPPKGWLGRTVDGVRDWTFMGSLHNVLDGVGFFPVIGDLIDLLHGVIYLGEMAYYKHTGQDAEAAMALVNAGLTFASALPIIGDIGGKPAKWGLKRALKTGVKRFAVQKGMQYAGGEIGRQIAGQSGQEWGRAVGGLVGAGVNAGMALRRGISSASEGVAEAGGTGQRPGFLTRVRRFFYDPRDHRTIGRKYWAARGPANGRSLHHWLIPQRARWVPRGIRNAGLNLLELPSLRGVFHRTLDLNTWMGFARNWGRGDRFNAMLVESTIRLGVPMLTAGTAYASYQIGDHLTEHLPWE